MTNDDPEHTVLASPPCFAHELDKNGYVVADQNNAGGVMRWRKNRRAELIAARLAVPISERKRVADEVSNVLDGLIDFGEEPVVSLYWPFRGELDLRDWMGSAYKRGARIALPVVVSKSQPLTFRIWTPGCKMERGVWNIPIPALPEIIIPTIVICPLVGYDPACFRLGYGGGFLTERWRRCLRAQR